MGSGRSYDVTPDGQRFLMVQVLEPLPEPATELILVTNSFEELRRLVPAQTIATVLKVKRSLVDYSGATSCLSA